MGCCNLTAILEYNYPDSGGCHFFDPHDAVGGICTRGARLFSLLWLCLALVNASKYTLGEIRYLGYGQLVLGICQLVECQLRPLVLGLGFWYTAHHLWNMDVVEIREKQLADLIMY